MERYFSIVLITNDVSFYFYHKETQMNCKRLLVNEEKRQNTLKIIHIHI